jgi:hypothetical protein
VRLAPGRAGIGGKDLTAALTRELLPVARLSSNLHEQPPPLSPK